jgi:4-amino-4-deoxy-L-arabinose transferase-like glycosyltransferase
MKVPIHDGVVYLLNAKSWLYSTEMYETYRPQMLSWIISGIWKLIGENWIITKYIQSAFTVGSGIILYMLIKQYKGSAFAFGVSTLTMVNATVFVYSTQILTEGVALFFLVLTLYLFKGKENHWFLAGITIGLTFASRYPIIIQALAIFVIESILVRKPGFIIRTILGVLLAISIVVLAIYLKTGEFETSLPKDSILTIFLSPFYLINSVDIWGFAFLLVPVAFFYRKTYTDKFNYSFIVWFLVSMLFWSANSTNHQYRFVIQFTPAVYFLAMLGLENFLYNLRSYKIIDRPRRT